jgi:hypothetical protein
MRRFARHARLTDASLLDAVDRAERGLIDADLGGGLIKQRVARAGEGRSGGFRTIIAYRMKERAFFLYGFARNERENIGNSELQTFKDIAAGFMACDDTALHEAVSKGAIHEIHEIQEMGDGEKTQQTDQSPAGNRRRHARRRTDER